MGLFFAINFVVYRHTVSFFIFLICLQVCSMKKQILLLVGYGDIFFDSKSRKCIAKSEDFKEKISKIIETGKYTGVVLVNETSDTFENVNLDGKINRSSIINVKLCSQQVFNKNNELTLFSTDGLEEIVMDGNNLDFILPPEQYSLSIAGVDINGIFVSLIEEARSLGYNLTVYSDIIKPYNKNTISTIRSSRVKFRAA